MQVNEKKICFIIYSEIDRYSEECLHFIDRLTVPAGYDVEVLVVTDVATKVDAYNDAMYSSDAKYKIYVDEKTYLFDKEIIVEIIRKFLDNEQIGMIGVAGLSNIQDTDNSYVQWEVGSIRYNTGYGAKELCTDGELYTIVEQLHGCFIATQYDFDWKSDYEFLTDKCAFKISHKIKEAGYNFAVVNREKASCYYNRDICKERQDEEIKSIFSSLSKLYYNGMFDELVSFTNELIEAKITDFDLKEIFQIAEIYELEKDINPTNLSWYFSEKVDYTLLFAETRSLLLLLDNNDDEEIFAKLKSLSLTEDFIRTVSATVFEENKKPYSLLMSSLDEEPLVSVILTNYNGEDMVGRSIESVLNQTYKNFELIVVDDASTDNSSEIIKKYAERDSRIKPLLLTKNRHVCYSSNQGFKEAKGKYLALLSYDDSWELSKLEKQVNFLEKHKNYVVCFTWSNIVDDYGKKGNPLLELVSDVFNACNTSSKNIIRRLVLDNNYLCAPSACIRRENAENEIHYFHGLVQTQDYDLWLRLLTKGYIYIYPEKLVNYTRFVNSGRNLSIVDEKTSQRVAHEVQWIKENFIWNMPNTMFIEVFNDLFRVKDSYTDEEILCEKIFLLMKAGDFFVQKHLMEAFEDERLLFLLEEKYNFTLKDYYQLNTDHVRWFMGEG